MRIGLGQPVGVDLQGQVSLAAALPASLADNTVTLRYIPQLRLDKQLLSNSRIGFDAAVNLNSRLLDGNPVQASSTLYRLTARFDSPATQMRLGLQKINFGPARMLRVLQWFDQLDVRDPLILSPGVWGLLFRRYFSNGSDLRLWALVNAPEAARLYSPPSNKKPVDMGGRIEYPLPSGTLGLTLHQLDIAQVSGIQQTRGALDIRLDAVIGLWSEMMAAHTTSIWFQQDNITVMIGMDYTLNIGNGLYLAGEGLSRFLGKFSSSLPWHTAQSLAFTANYPLGLEDSITGYFYALDSEGGELKNIPMLGWQHTQGNWLLYLAVYTMPEGIVTARLPLPTGTGLQVNLAFNH